MVPLPEYFKVHGYNTTGCGKTYHAGHPNNFDIPRSWTAGVDYLGYNQGLGFCGDKCACVIPANVTDKRTDEGEALFCVCSSPNRAEQSTAQVAYNPTVQHRSRTTLQYSTGLVQPYSTAQVACNPTVQHRSRTTYSTTTNNLLPFPLLPLRTLSPPLHHHHIALQGLLRVQLNCSRATRRTVSPHSLWLLASSGKCKHDNVGYILCSVVSHDTEGNLRNNRRGGGGEMKRGR